MASGLGRPKKPFFGVGGWVACRLFREEVVSFGGSAPVADAVLCQYSGASVCFLGLSVGREVGFSRKNSLGLSKIGLFWGY